MAAKLKKGDTVIVTCGRDRGKTGEILEINLEEGFARVANVNMRRRHVKANQRQNMPEGGIRELPGKTHISNLRFYSSETKGVRVGFRVEGKDKIRVARGRAHGGVALDG